MEQHDVTAGQQPLPAGPVPGMRPLNGMTGKPMMMPGTGGMGKGMLPAVGQPLPRPRAGVQPPPVPPFAEAPRTAPHASARLILPAEVGGVPGVPTAQLSPQFMSHLYQILQMIESNLPADEVAHSFHVQAAMDPAVRALPAMQRFDVVGAQNLHAKVTIAGFIRRILTGDRSPEVMRGLQEQVRVTQQSHSEMRTAITQLMAAEAGRANAAVRALSQVMPMIDQAHRTVMPMLQPLLSIQVRGAAAEAIEE